MESLISAFEERLEEIDAYLSFLEVVETQAQSGPPHIGRSDRAITTMQQRILYSGVYLQLYNLVESTIVRCLDSVTNAAFQGGAWGPADLTEDFRREWVRVKARTHVDLSFENRLASALALCDHLIAALPVSGFKVEKSAGNWDDGEIERVAKRLGFEIRVKKTTYAAVKRKLRDDLGPLGLVKKFRNQLAHGSISFAECGENLTVRELRDLTNYTGGYLREVVKAFESYVSEHQFLDPVKRPNRANA